MSYDEFLYTLDNLLQRTKLGEKYYHLKTTPYDREPKYRNKCNISDDENIIAINDLSITPLNADGVIFTDKAVYFKYLFSNAKRVSYSDLAVSNIYHREGHIYI